MQSCGSAYVMQRSVGLCRGFRKSAHCVVMLHVVMDVWSRAEIGPRVDNIYVVTKRIHNVSLDWHCLVRKFPNFAHRSSHQVIPKNPYPGSSTDSQHLSSGTKTLCTHVLAVYEYDMCRHETCCHTDNVASQFCGSSERHQYLHTSMLWCSGFETHATTGNIILQHSNLS